MSEVYGIPIEWYGDGLIVEMWLDGPAQSLFCRLLLDTGATHLVVGRPVMQAEDPAAAADALVAEMAG